MTALNEKLVDDVLSLPVDMRLVLIDRLLRSVQLPSRAGIDEVWAKEAERRIDQVESGKVQTLPGEQVFKEIRERLKR